MDETNPSETLDETAVLNRVRSHVGSLLADGAEPATVAYVLAFAATELGLGFAPDPRAGYGVVLTAVCQASGSGMTGSDGPAPGESVH